MLCSLLTGCTIPCACHAKRHLNFLNVQKWSKHVVFFTFWLGMCFAPQRSALFQHLNFEKWSGLVSFWNFWLRNVLHATTACTFSPSQLPNVVWHCQFFTLLTSKCASHHDHNDVHFFIISTSKSAPRMVCFVRFDFDMCFVPQRRATTTFIWPDGSAPAALGSLLFDPPEPQISESQLFCDSFFCDSFFWLLLLTLSLLWSSFFFSSLLLSSPLLSSPLRFASLLFSSLLLSSLLFSSLLFLFSSLLFSSLLFSSLLFSDSSHLCFSICPYCRKFDF